MLKGFATAEGTKSFRDRFLPQLEENHFREREGLWLSSIGMGSYLGEPDEATDLLYGEAMTHAVSKGINVFDTAANYRCQRSERVYGKTLAGLVAAGRLRREEFFVSTKGGFLSFDGAYPADPAAYVRDTFLKPGILREEDLVDGMHSLSPSYLEHQLRQSLQNLELETIDLYYLHNPEMQLGSISVETFKKRMIEAFRWLEEKVREGRIRMYGTATWNGYRIAETSKSYLELQTVNLWAREAAGAMPHFKAVQLPVNFAMPEAWVLPNQRFGPNKVSLLNAAERMGVMVMASAPMLQGRLLKPLPDFLGKYFKELKKSSQQCLQFVRSLPGLTTALAGMKQTAHVDENLEVAKQAPLTDGDLVLMFSQQGESSAASRPVDS